MEKIIKKLSKNDQESIKEILSLFSMVDAEARRFVGLTGIRCPAGCGSCCKNQQVETTALEMLPLAAYLWAKNEADNALSGLSGAVSGTCIFFQKDSKDRKNGCCGVYELRPLICRLFGFFTVKDKYGKYVYGSCRLIKEAYPDAYKKALKAIEGGQHPSSMTDFAIRVLAQGSDLGRKMLPINNATKIALERIGYILSLTETPP